MPCLFPSTPLSSSTMSDDAHPIDPTQLRDAAHQASEMLRVLANENRLLLMCQLSQGERSVGELEALLHIHQPTLSQQLGILRNKHLVATRRSGKQIFYRVNNEQALHILQMLYTLYCPAPRQEKA